MTEQKALLQGQDWAGEMGEKWNRYRARFEGMIAPIGQATLAHAGFKLGERVLDIGCGAGPTTLDIARLVGTQGVVTGLDISHVLIDTATVRAQQAGLSQVGFVCGDAATLQLPVPAYDHLFSRFGVMFFEDPFAAFKNMRRMLHDSSRMTFCCWGPPPHSAATQSHRARPLRFCRPNPYACHYRTGRFPQCCVQGLARRPVVRWPRTRPRGRCAICNAELLRWRSNSGSARYSQERGS